MKQQQPGTVHSRISSLQISRRLTRPRVASSYSARTSSHFNPLPDELFSVEVTFSLYMN